MGRPDFSGCLGQIIAGILYNTSEAVLHISHSITSNPSSLCRWYEGSQGAGLICSLHSPTSLPTVTYNQIGRQHHAEDVDEHLVLFPGLFSHSVVGRTSLDLTMFV